MSVMDPGTAVTTGSADFYIQRDQQDSSSLVYCTSGASSDVHTSASALSPGSVLHAIATSPDLESSVDPELPAFRRRSHSAPSVLYQQVALQLRNISDDFNQEYSSNEAAAMPRPPPQQQGRRMSLPTNIHEHRPRSPNWLHSMIQAFRRQHNAPPRPHRDSMSQVPEENADDDEVDLDPAT